MHRHALRWLGFAVPTVSVVTAAHLSAESSAGEALDGVVSGLFFTLPFVATAWLRSRLEPRRPRARLRSPVWEIVLGLLPNHVFERIPDPVTGYLELLSSRVQP